MEAGEQATLRALQQQEEQLHGPLLSESLEHFIRRLLCTLGLADYAKLIIKIYSAIAMC